MSRVILSPYMFIKSVWYLGIMTSFSAILVASKTPGNIGAVARTLENFNGDELILVNPRCELDDTAYSRARSGHSYLDNARTVSSLEELDSYEALFATTGVLGGPGNMRRKPIYADQLSDYMPTGTSKVGLVFGREDQGLYNEELEMCDHVVHIRSHEDYPILNLSHAAGIIFYEAFLATEEQESSHRHPNREEKKKFLAVFKDVMQAVNDDSLTSEDEILLAMRRLLVRSNVSKEEFGALFKFLRRVQDVV